MNNSLESSNWTNLNFLEDNYKCLINNYFKDKTGVYNIENNILTVKFDNWGIEKFYLDNNTPSNTFYQVVFNNFKKIHNVSICIQVGNWTTFKKMEHFLNNFKNIYVNIYIVLIENLATLENINSLKHLPDTVILKGENKGMDIGLFLIALHYIKIQKYNHEYIFKIHTKTHDGFRNETLVNLLGSHNKIINNIRALSDKNVGMISGNLIYRYYEDKDIFHSNMYHLKYLVQKIFNENIDNSSLEFPAATFFIAKYKIFKFLSKEILEELYFELNDINTLDYYWYSMFYNININNKINIYKDYTNNKNSRYCNNVDYQKKTNKPGLRDCMIEHAFERLFGYFCKKQGLNIIRNQ